MLWCFSLVSKVVYCDLHTVIRSVGLQNLEAYAIKLKTVFIEIFFGSKVPRTFYFSIMDKGQYHHMSEGFRARVEFPPQVRTPLPPPPPLPLLSNALHQQGHIPYDSSQCHAPPLPPPPFPPPLVPNTFQNKRTTDATTSQSTTPSSSFRGPSYPAPDFTRPPPSFCSYEKKRQGMSHGVQQGVNVVVTHQDYGCHSMITHQSYGFSTASLPSGVASNQLTHNVPGDDGRNTVNSSCSQHSSRIVSTCEEASSFEKQDDQVWLRNFEQQVLERNGEQNECGTSKKKPIKVIFFLFLVAM